MTSPILPGNNALIPDLTSLYGALRQLQINIVNINSTTGVTIPALNMLAGIIVRGSQTGTDTDTTDTADNIVSALTVAGYLPAICATCLIFMVNLSSGFALNLAGGTGVTLVGATQISSMSCRLFLLTVTGVGARGTGQNTISLQGCFQLTSATP